MDRMTDSEVKYAINRLECGNTAHSKNASYIKFAINALKMQIPMKPELPDEQVFTGVKTYHCPSCGLGITGTNIAKWCYHCGQRMDWSDYDEA